MTEDEPCCYCPYASEATDSTGHDYYQCDLDDDPNLYANAMCCIKDDE